MRTSLAQSCGRRGHRCTAAAVDLDARKYAGCENTLLISYGMRHYACGFVIEVNSEHGSMFGGVTQLTPVIPALIARPSQYFGLH